MKYCLETQLDDKFNRQESDKNHSYASLADVENDENLVCH